LISLQPRYRRLLTVGALLDESILLFRQHWIAFALFSLVALVPQWLVLLLSSTTSITRGFVRASIELPSAQDWAALLGLTLVQALFSLLWSAASTTAAATYLGGDRPTVGGIYGLALKRLARLFLATLVYLVLFMLLFFASTVLFVVTLLGTLGTLIALIGLINWWVKPESRRPWLKWLIILTAPYGLATYYAVRWSLFLPSIVLEGEGAIGSLRRSSRLVEGQWFRAGAVLTLASLIVTALVLVPLFLGGMIVALAGLAGAFADQSGLGSILSNTATIVLQVLFSSIGTITYVMLFVDLRNRREGTDIGERISSLEAATA